jgi:hypothetical protein
LIHMVGKLPRMKNDIRIIQPETASGQLKPQADSFLYCLYKI